MKRADPPVTRYLTPGECHQVHAMPYAVYGGKVYSLRVRIPGQSAFEERLIVHGSERYREFVAMADAAGNRLRAQECRCYKVSQSKRR